MDTITKNMKTVLNGYFSRRKEAKDGALQLRRQSMAEHDVQVMEYKSALWLACKGIPLVSLSAIKGDENALYEVLNTARENYIECELKGVFK